MRQRDLLLGLGFLGAFSMGAVTSPFTGSVAPTEGEQDFYIYQVESGKWLQNNLTNPAFWHTRGALEKYGFDWNVKVVEGGFQLDPKFGNNHSMCGNEGEGYYLDTNNAVTVWGFNPVTVDGVSNAYQIEGLSGAVRDGIAFLLGESDGSISDSPEGTTWQLVTRAERIQYMKDAVANGPVDATWLIPDPDFANANERDAQHIRRGNNDNGGGLARGGDDGAFRCNLVRECWHMIQNYQDFVVLEGLPNGTYRFRVQGYYRDYDGDSEGIATFWEHYHNNTQTLRAEYFANDGINKVMSITNNAPTEQPNDFEWTYDETTGIYIPGKMRAAARYFVEADAYQNDWVECVVTDGTLVLGVQKRTADTKDWFIYDNFQLQYISTATTPALTALQAEVDGLVTEARALPMTPGVEAALAAAEEATKTTNPAGLRRAALELASLIGNVQKAAPAINNYNLVKALCGNIDTTEADERFAAASTTTEFNDALTHLRNLRRRAAAERQPDLFKGAEAVPGDYYLYNVGQQQFLIGGGDWGAHAALNLVGKEMTLEIDDENDIADRTYHIRTYLNNGGENEFINYAGYLDTGKAGKWLFMPVEGKENVYYIVQNDYQDAYWRWDMYGSHNSSDESTVTTECRSPKFEDSLDDLNAQWKLVTRAEREALLENASLENPVDASFFIPAPGFNQRDAGVESWSRSEWNLIDRGGNHMDHVIESWNTEACELSTEVPGLPAGIYKVGVQGYYRVGKFSESVNDREGSALYLMAGDDVEDDKAIVNIYSAANMAPGEGQDVKDEDGNVYNIPNQHWEAARFFRAGLYKNFTVIEYDGSSDLFMGLYKDAALAPEDWCVIDNFRLTYYGTDTTKEEVAGIDEVIADDSAAEYEGDGRIYNLQGIRVAAPTAPGIYIRNGKKFVVK